MCVEPCLNLAQFDSECKTKALSQTKREDMSVLFGNQEREASKAAKVGCISSPFGDAQDRLLWRDKTCPACP